MFRPIRLMRLKKYIKKLNIQYDFCLFNNLIKYFQKSDLAITRSGASSLAELTNVRIPFIAIPLPTSADNHQFMNANYFKKKIWLFIGRKVYF